VAEDSEPAEVDLDPLRHVDVDVSEQDDRREPRHGVLELGLPQVEIHVPKQNKGEADLGSRQRPVRTVFARTAAVKRFGWRRRSAGGLAGRSRPIGSSSPNVRAA
jgi:hypothetical protein